MDIEDPDQTGYSDPQVASGFEYQLAGQWISLVEGLLDRIQGNFLWVMW